MKKLSKLICVIFILGIIFNAQNFVLGQSASDGDVQALNNQIAEKQKKLKDLEAKQKQYANAIQAKQKEQTTLANQLSVLSDLLVKAELDLETTKAQVDQTNLEIAKTNLEINNKTAEIEKEKKHIASILRLIYKQDRVNTIEMMLLNNSLSDFLNQMKYLENINGEVVKSVDHLKSYQAELTQKKNNLDTKNKELLALKASLEDEQAKIENNKDAKSYVLTESKNSEKQYQRLLQQAKQQQLQAENEIAGLEKTVRAKLATLGDDNKLIGGSSTLIWPVPKNKITSTFHDPDYPFRNILGEHPAVDIRTAQGTTIKAPASGYVAKVKNGGMGYSYIMLVHANNISTVYGHVSNIFVKNGEYVSQGQAIGLSGGAPGTPGAGPFSTGAHLHFEVRSNGLPANPLSYLP